jgi:hypothetical protein
MKNRLFLLTLLTVGLVQCGEEGEPQNQLVNFTFNILNYSGGRIQPLTLPQKASVYISLSHTTGESVLSNHKIEIIKSGDQYVTRPIELKPARYEITDFLVTNENDSVLYVIPKRRPDMPLIVEHPLPYNFDLVNKQVETFPLNVVDISLHDLKTLGYSGVTHPFRVSVFAMKNKKLHPIDATLLIEQNDSVLFSYALKPKVNLLSFEGDRSGSYTIRVSKEGYDDFYQNFNYEELINILGPKPLKIILEGNKCSFHPVHDPQVWLTVKGSGKLEVNWGDGSKETLTFRGTPGDHDKLSYHLLAHEYAGNFYPVKLSGDLDQIVEFISISSLESVDLSALRKLQNITFENSQLSSLDLSENKELRSIAFIHTTLDKIIFPVSHQVNSINMEEIADGMSKLPVDYIIDHIYRNAVRYNIIEGAFVLFNIGDLSSESREKLTKLETAYRWYVEIE